MNSKCRVSLEVAKKLEKSGFPQEEFDAYWLEYFIIKDYGIDSKKVRESLSPEIKINSRRLKQYETHYLCNEVGTLAVFFYNMYAAPCSGNIGEMLPWTINQSGRDYRLEILKRGDDSLWYASYRYYTSLIISVENKSLEDCLSLMYIELSERGLL